MGLKQRLKYWLDVILGDEAQRRALGPRRKTAAPQSHVDKILFPDQPAPPAMTKAAVDAYLAQVAQAIRADKPPALPSVIVTGAMRCGKTRVAKAVSQETGMIHMPSDRLREAIYGDADGAVRARLIKYAYKRLLLMHPTGLVLEGTVFLDTDNALLAWAKKRGVQTFVIGYARNRVARKARSMIKFRQRHECWTTDRYSDEDMTRLARRIILHSQNLRARAKVEGLTYLDLDSAHFQPELARVTGVILRALHHRHPRAQRRARGRSQPRSDGQPAE